MKAGTELADPMRSGQAPSEKVRHAARQSRAVLALAVRARSARAAPTGAMALAGGALVAILVALLAALAGPVARMAFEVTGAVAQESRDWSFPTVVNDDGRTAVQSDPAVAEDGAGTLHAAWVDDRDGAGTAIFYSRLLPGAGRWEANQRVAAGVPGARRAFPDIAVDAYGGVHVVWLEYVSGDPEIFHSVLSATRPPFSQAKRVNDDRGPGLQWSPSVAADRSGNVHAAWVDYREGTADVYHRRRSRDGEWAAALRVNDVTRGDQSFPALAAAPTGDLFAVWLDTRDGSTQVQASRLPPGGDLWWPNALLSSNASGTAMSAPSATSDDRGLVHAVWGSQDASGTTVQAAVFHLAEDSSGFWARGREVFRPANGSVLEVDVSGGPGDLAFVAWSESRPDTSRIYAARLTASGELEPVRIDGAPSIVDGRTPRVVIDGSPAAHVLWQGVGRAGDAEIYHSRASLERPSYPSAENHGWLEYVGRQPACGRDMYRLVSCDGSPGPLVWTRLPEINTLTGSYVSVRGLVIDEGTCHHVEAYDVTLHPSPCPRTTGSVTGVLTSAGRPIEGAQVRVDGREVTSGPSGRFFASELAPGPHTITATARCALTARIDDVDVPSGFQKTVPPGEVLRTDVVEDCAVDLHDLMRVGRSYKSRPPFVPTCVDLDMDGTVSVFDLSVVAANYGRRCPTWWQDAAFDALGGRSGTSRSPAADALGAQSGPVSSRAADALGGRSGPSGRLAADAPGGQTGPSRGLAANVLGGQSGPSGSLAADALGTGTAGQRDSIAADGTVWRVDLADASTVRGWAIELTYDADRTELVDTSPTTPGTQPFDTSVGSEGVFVVENTASDGVARLAAVVLAPQPSLEGGRLLARIETLARTRTLDRTRNGVAGTETDTGDAPLTVLDVQLASGSASARAEGRIDVSRAVERHERIWMPLAARGSGAPRQ